MMSQWLIQYLSVDVVDGRVAAELVVAVDVELVVVGVAVDFAAVDVLSVDRLLLAVDIEVLGLERDVVDGSVPLLKRNHTIKLTDAKMSQAIKFFT